MTDSNAASTSEVFDPKLQTLKDLLNATFWDHLATGADWKHHIKRVLEDSTKQSYEADNIELQKEVILAHKVIAEQEVKLKRLETLVEDYRQAAYNARDNLEQAANTLAKIRSYNYL